MIEISIDIKVDDREHAYDVLNHIGVLIENGHFGAACSKDAQDKFRGTIFVIDETEN